MFLIKKFKKLKNKYSSLHFLVNLILRPKQQYDNYILGSIKLLRFLLKSQKLLSIENTLKIKNKEKNENLLIFAGKFMESSWIQIWLILTSLISDEFNHKYVVTSRKSILTNLYFLRFKFKFIYIEDFKKKIILEDEFIRRLSKLKELNQIRDFRFANIPLGRIALSTYCRSRKTGLIKINNEKILKEITSQINYYYSFYKRSEKLLEKFKIKHLFFTEVFMDEYGAFYYAALNKKLNILRFCSTVRDNAIVLNRLTFESDRKHFSSFSQSSWEKIKKYPENKVYIDQLNQNFIDRYSQKWILSSRNQPRTKYYDDKAIREIYSIPKNKKIAIIYSHILFDLLYFHGHDLFDNYADWFVKTIKEIIKNKNLTWFIKIHPSNIWRGELHKFYNPKTEEENLINKEIGTLPDHVKLIYPDTKISPISWMKFTDFGITVRGTVGIELSAMGKQVVTAGSGRYEQIGFTINPKDEDEYIKILQNLHTHEPISQEKINLAKRFAYATFCMKPFTLDFVSLKKGLGVEKVLTFDDFNFLPDYKKIKSNNLPNSIKRFKKWYFHSKETDYLNEWPN